MRPFRAIDPRLLAQQRRAGLPNRTERTPYYVVDVPRRTARAVLDTQQAFIRTLHRDYEDEDPQFWECLDGSTPVESGTIERFIRHLCTVMEASNHHPAHIHAIRTTRLFIFGCGSCLDDCLMCNFRYVPEGWTRRWKQAVEDSGKWTSNLTQPSMADIEQVNRTRRRE